MQRNVLIGIALGALAIVPGLAAKFLAIGIMRAAR